MTNNITRISENTFLVKGSPSTIIHYNNRDRECIIIDPGYQKKRIKSIQKQLDNKCENTRVILTHYHADHTQAVLWMNIEEVIAPVKDAGIMQTPRVIHHLTYGYPFTNKDDIVMIKPESIKPTITIDPPLKENKIEYIELTGHTIGQIGVIIDSNIFYTADAFFGEKILEVYKIPYHQLLMIATETLEKIMDEAQEYIIVPSHGPIVKGTASIELIEKNIKRNKEIIDNIINSLHQPRGINEIAMILHKKYRLTPSLFSLLLAENTVRGIITDLKNKGIIKPIITEKGVLWKIG